MTHPTAFLSYSWDSDTHRRWVREFAARLRSDGIESKLEQWETVPGDQLPPFMEAAVRDNDFVIAICTPKYKRRADDRTGGVGYEGGIMTGEVFTTQNQRKFIPVLREGDWNDAAPSWMVGKYYIDLRGTPYSEEQYDVLQNAILGIRELPPPVSQPSSNTESRSQQAPMSSRVQMSWIEFNDAVQRLSRHASRYNPDLIVGVGVGGAILGCVLAGNLNKSFICFDRDVHWASGKRNESLRDTAITKERRQLVEGNRILVASAEIVSGQTTRDACDVILRMKPVDIKTCCIYAYNSRDIDVDYFFAERSGEVVQMPWRILDSYSCPDDNARL